MTDKPLHYLDSGVFSGFLNGEAEPDNFDEGTGLLVHERSKAALGQEFTHRNGAIAVS